MIKRKVNESMHFTGGAELTPQVTVGKFFCPGSMNHGETNLQINQECYMTNGDGIRTITNQSVSLSIETMKAIIAWAESK